MHNKVLRKRAELLYDNVNNTPPVTFKFSHMVKNRDVKE